MEPNSLAAAVGAPAFSIEIAGTEYPVKPMVLRVIPEAKRLADRIPWVWSINAGGIDVDASLNDENGEDLLRLLSVATGIEMDVIDEVEHNKLLDLFGLAIQANPFFFGRIIAQRSPPEIQIQMAGSASSTDSSSADTDIPKS